MYQVADSLPLRALEEKLPIIVIGPFNLTKQQLMMKKTFNDAVEKILSIGDVFRHGSVSCTCPREYLHFIMFFGLK